MVEAARVQMVKLAWRCVFASAVQPGVHVLFKRLSLLGEHGGSLSVRRLPITDCRRGVIFGHVLTLTPNDRRYRFNILLDNFY